jgi:hypothetical protein
MMMMMVISTPVIIGDTTTIIIIRTIPNQTPSTTAPSIDHIHSQQRKS